MEIEIFETTVGVSTGEELNGAEGTDRANLKPAESHVLAATTIIGAEVRNYGGESLGKIEDLVIDLKTGRLAYAVLSFGGFLGVGNKLFAIPIQLMHSDSKHKIFMLNVEKQLLRQAPGFDKSNWPDFADEDWQAQISVYYGVSQFFSEPARH